MVVIVGVFLVVFGFAFASSPIRFARSVRWARDQPIPPSPSKDQLRYFRISGFAVAAVGVVLLLLALLA